MPHLTILNRPADLPQNLSLTITSQNARFNSSGGETTLELTLPLRSSERNQAIFTPLYLSQTDLSHTPSALLPYRLEAAPLLLQGTCKVTAITPESVSIQLTAAAADTRLTDDSTYIDELQLGRVWDDEHPEIYTHYRGNPYFFLASRLLRGTGVTTLDPLISQLRGAYPSNSAVWYPIYSTADDADVNNFTFFQYNSSYEVPHGTTVAAQPYLLHIVKRVFRALGYTFIDNLDIQRWKLQTFIASCRQTTYLSDLLPHWSVKDFLTYVQDFLRIEFVYTNTEVRIRENLTDTLQLPEVQLPRLTTSRQTDPDDDAATTDPLLSNVCFEAADALCSAACLPPEAFKNTPVHEFQTFSELQAWYTATTPVTPTFTTLPEAQRPQRQVALPAADKYLMCDLFFVTEERQYYFVEPTTDSQSSESTYTLRPCHYLGGLYRHDLSEREADLTLHFTPSLYTMRQLRVYTDASTSKYFMHPFLTSDLSTTFTRSKAPTIQSFINTESDEDDESTASTDTSTSTIDHLFVAINHQLAADSLAPYPLCDAHPRAPWHDGGTVHSPYEPLHTALCPLTLQTAQAGDHLTAPAGTLAAEFLAPTDGRAHTPNLSTPLTATFLLSDAKVQYGTTSQSESAQPTPLPVTARFIIENRPYLCKKLEYTITSEGLSPLVRGVFLPLTL